MEYVYGIALMLLIVIIIKSPIGKGMFGEFVLRTIMGKNKPKKDTFVIHNLTFYDGTKSLEIPHVIVNSYGVHIIETLEDNGVITGRETDKTWSKKLWLDQNTYSIPNPIKSIASKTLSLKSVMLKKAPIYTYIVCTGRVKIKVETHDVPVLYPRSLMHKMRHIKKTEQSLKPMDVRKVYEGLKNLKLMNRIGHKEDINLNNHNKIYQKHRP